MKNRGLWFLARAVATLILIGVLVGGGFALYYAGVFKGYAASDLVAEGEEAAKPAFLPDNMPHFGYRHYRHYRPFGAIGMLFKVVLCFVFIGIIAKLIRFVVWGSMFRHGWCGPWGKPWHGPHGIHGRRAHKRHAHHYRHGPPMPPWCWDWDEDENEEAEGSDDEPATEN